MPSISLRHHAPPGKKLAAAALSSERMREGWRHPVLMRVGVTTSTSVPVCHWTGTYSWPRHPKASTAKRHTPHKQRTAYTRALELGRVWFASYRHRDTAFDSHRHRHASAKPSSPHAALAKSASRPRKRARLQHPYSISARSTI